MLNLPASHAKLFSISILKKTQSYIRLQLMKEHSVSGKLEDIQLIHTVKSFYQFQLAALKF